jgi:hypothetical protein
MNNWERLVYKRERLRVYFWAARQALFLLFIAVLVISTVVEMALAGRAPMLEQFFALVGR